MILWGTPYFVYYNKKDDLCTLLFQSTITEQITVTEQPLNIKDGYKRLKSIEVMFVITFMCLSYKCPT